MKINFKHFIFLFFAVLIAANIYIFVSSIRLGAVINHFENEIVKLDLENRELENKSFQVDSLQYASSVAAQLKFDHEAPPLYLKSANYAFKP